MPDASDNRTALPIAEAAERMGLSVETLRKRLQRGRVEGFKAADGTWRIVVDNTGPSGNEAVESIGDEVAATREAVEHLRQDLITLARAVEKLADQVITVRSQSARAESLLEAVANKLAMLTARDRPQPVTKEDLKPLLSGVLDLLQRQRGY